ncbi:Long-chain-fatty-acid--CoA ligase [Rhodovulum sp. PH10]|uniref:class I adenylate-forming enzyme family protein n=1 Tax=Rhodovulum sp. PH10 TaxID=1187851 RepID=UPI00027C2D9C|nr:long-chain fatty acid--CoA ligase [Rhodovulum sp. PH10]EJW11041.1 Long-chain-fatty-acid--CoA ligase [Rhodovulum sp. PH10]
MQLTRSLVRASRISPDKTALIFHDRRWTWHEHASRVARLAGALRTLGVGPGDRVAILAHSSDRFIESVFAILWAGGVLVPLNARATPGDIAGMLDDCDAAVLLVGADFLPLLPTLRAGAQKLRHVIALDDGATPTGTIPYADLITSSDETPRAETGGDDLAAIFYTGGTTGPAKGVMLSHANLYANALHGIAQFGGHDERTVYLHSGPLYHLAAGSRVFTTTILGATHVVIPRFTVEGVLDAIKTHRVTMTAMVPTMLAMILSHPAFEHADLSSLSFLVYGGSPMPEALIVEAMRRLPHVRFGQGYGMTELSPACTYLEPRHHSLDPALRHRLRSVGRPAMGVDIRILDEAGHDRPTGEVGEIAVAGPIVMQGYWKRPDATREVLRDGVMHTGDLGYLDRDGFLYIVDRLKDMIVTGGEKVFCIEVEDVMRKHPAVALCAVVGRPHPIWGEAVHGVVVPRPGASVTADEIVAHCRAHLAGYKVPRSIEFRTAMPLSGANKILKTVLRAT